MFMHHDAMQHIMSYLTELLDTRLLYAISFPTSRDIESIPLVRKRPVDSWCIDQDRRRDLSICVHFEEQEFPPSTQPWEASLVQELQPIGQLKASRRRFMERADASHATNSLFSHN
jgi:hypothetical protein